MGRARAFSSLGRGVSLLGALAAGLAGVRPAVGQEGMRSTCAVEVERAGWVKVPLAPGEMDPRVPARPDLRLFAPDGEELSFEVVSAGEAAAWLPLPPPALEETAAGRTLLLDLGSRPPRHDRLRLGFGPPGIAGGLAVEGSADGATWEPLDPGDRLPPGERAPRRESTVVYPATDLRFLRLLWPREAGVPELRRAEVGAVPARSYQLSFAGAECAPGVAGQSRCRLPLGERGQAVRRLDLELRGEGSVGYRLAVPHAGRWEVTQEGIWSGLAGSGRRSLDLGSRRVEGDSLRLELFGSGAAPPAVSAFGATFEVQALRFRAREPGRFQLTWGDGVAAALAGQEPGEAQEPPHRARWVEPGPVETAPLPPLEAPQARLGGRAPPAVFEASFPVVAAGREPGALFRLELPALVYRHAGPELARLRLVAAGRRVPWARWSPAEPVLALERADLAPRPVAAGHSRIDLAPIEPGIPWTALELVSAAGAFRRQVRLVAPDPAEPRVERGLTAWESWTCEAPVPLPCRLSLALDGGAPAAAWLEFDDAGEAPLPDVDAVVWRRRDVLLFLWPETDAPIVLAAGGEPEQPGEDFAALASQLLTRSWAPAELGLPAPGERSAGGWERWLLVGFLVAGLALLTLVARFLVRARA